MFEDIELNAIQEENARELVKRLLNVVEQLSREVRDLRVENQRLRDENNRLKGEQGKPNIKGNKAPAPKTDHSSELERHKKRVRHKKSKKVEVRIDRDTCACAQCR
jgi:regulator of replication initiation timing